MAGTRGVTVPKLSLTKDSDRSETTSLLGSGRRFTQLLRIARKNGLLPFRKLDFSHTPSGAPLRTIQADHLRRALEEAGGAFVKMGQLLSTRTDLLPEEYVAALSLLQQNVKPAPWAAVKALLEDEFRAPLESVFATIDPEPIAAASIGQVHRAVLKSGEIVAVKVQRPGIVPEVRRDVAIALRVTRVLSFSSPQARALGVTAAAEQYADDLLRQLDFQREAINLSALRALQSRSPRPTEIRFPELFTALSTDRVLVMEFLEGQTLTQWKNGPRSNEVQLNAAMRLVLRAFVRQIVFDGVYHSDLHPGNIMMLADDRPGLVDFGSVGRLDLQLRETIQELLIAYLQSDNQRIADALLTLAPLAEGADEKKYRRELSNFITLELGPGARISVETVDALVLILAQYGLTVPAELIAAARAFAILEGTLRSTIPQFDLLEEARSLASEQITDQMAPTNLRDILTTELLALLPSVRRLPRRLDLIGQALETGKLNVNIRLLADRRDRRMLGGYLRQSFLAILGSLAGLAALIFLTVTPPLHQGVVTTAAAGFGLAIGAAALLLAALVDVIVSRSRD